MSCVTAWPAGRTSTASLTGSSGSRSGHRAHRGSSDTAAAAKHGVRRTRSQWQRWLEQQESRCVACLAGAAQFWPEVDELGAQVINRLRRGVHTERTGHLARLSDVLVGLLGVELGRTVPTMSGEEAVDLAHVHPSQQVRIVRRVRSAIGCCALYPVVHGTDRGDRSLRRPTAGPYVVAAKNSAVRCSRPHGSWR